MLEWSFDTRDAGAARRARIELVQHVNRLYGARADAATAELVLGELIGNAVRYAPGRAYVKAVFDRTGVTIAVQDSGSGFALRPAGRENNLLNESGRGLAIVSRLAKSLEIDCAPQNGCCVRARLDVTGHPN